MASGHEELPVEDPLQNEVALNAVHRIAQARFPSQLKGYSKEIYSMQRSGGISDEEAEVLRGELHARKQILQPGITPARAIQEMPPAGQSQEVQPSSEEREYDWAERASGEYLDRD